MSITPPKMPSFWGMQLPSVGNVGSLLPPAQSRHRAPHLPKSSRVSLCYPSPPPTLSTPDLCPFHFAPSRMSSEQHHPVPSVQRLASRTQPNAFEVSRCLFAEQCPIAWMCHSFIQAPADGHLGGFQSGQQSCWTFSFLLGKYLAVTLAGGRGQCLFARGTAGCVSWGCTFSHCAGAFQGLRTLAGVRYSWYI